jgi:hypothetical protein
MTVRRRDVAAATRTAWRCPAVAAFLASWRWCGSFEFTFDSDWRIALTYLDRLERWEAEQSNPLTDSFCEAGRIPWA